MLVRAVDEVGVPQLRVLLGQRYEPTGAIEPGRGPCGREVDERREPVRLGVVRHEGGQDLGQLHRFGR